MDIHQLQVPEEFTLEVEGLFGGDEPQTVVGSLPALTALQQAFDSGLTITQEVSSGHEAFDFSCVYFQDIAAMPDFRRDVILSELNDETVRSVNKLDDIDEEGKPHFQAHYFNINGVPKMLRCLSKHHAQRYFGKFNYQLGVLTLSDGFLTAQVFASTLQKMVSHTIWVFRRIAAPLNVGEQYSEIYAAFMLPEDLARPVAQYTPRGQVLATKRGGRPATEVGQQSTVTPAQQAGIAERQDPKSRGSSAAAWKNKRLYDERKVDASNFDDGRLHPDDIQGELVLEIVPFISTTDLHARINDLYEKLGERRKGNFATLRFRNALIAKCEREGLDRKEEWIKVQNARRMKGVKVDTGNPPALHLGVNKGNAFARRKSPVFVENEDMENDMEEGLEASTEGNDREIEEMEEWLNNGQASDWAHLNADEV